MCGICGVIHHDGKPVEKSLLKTMNDTLNHRGPDGEGYHIDGHVGLAMRRLSIIDVSGSDQPLYNEDQSIALVFNGEIYNFRELRHMLQQQGHEFRTDGDGETIVHLYEQYGTDAPKYLRGQFAFALWDSNDQKLFLARDRFGQKPLYFSQIGKKLIFASEIKAILQHPEVRRESDLLSPKTLAFYLQRGYPRPSATAFSSIKELFPGQSLCIFPASGHPTVASKRLQDYWTLPEISNEQHTGDDIQPYIEGVREHLQKATELRMIADVPVGAFLSGGLDSSLIVALMQQMTDHKVKTFSIGFEGDDSFDETIYAEEVANYLGTHHTTFKVKPDAIGLLDKLVYHHDQPFGDSSAIPTFLVSELTRKHVTVALNGDGGDELFAGYERFYAASLVQKLGFMPRPVWQGATAALDILPEGTGYRNTVKRAKRFTSAASKPLLAAYQDWVSIFDEATIQELVPEYRPAPSQNGNTTLAEILHYNQETYLPYDLLIKADRSSMAASLEARSPFLDHELAAYAATIPINLKLRGSTTKYILKEAARGILPDHIIDRKKHGFGVPLGAWLRKDISPVRDLLLSQKARQRSLLNMQVVERLINEHASGQRDHNRQLWALLTLESWHRQFIDR